MKIIVHVLVVWALASTAIYSGLIWHLDRHTIVVRPVQIELACEQPSVEPQKRHWRVPSCVWG